MPHIDQENNSNNDVKSSQSRVHAFARFYNKTQRTVNVIWINYQGTRVRYKTLQKGEWIDVNTFVGHPWVFHDAITGDKLHVQSNVQETNSPQSASVCNTGEASSEQDSVYNPVPWNKDNDSWPPKRRIVYITVPGTEKVVFCFVYWWQKNAGYTLLGMCYPWSFILIKIQFDSKK